MDLLHPQVRLRDDLRALPQILGDGVGVGEVLLLVADLVLETGPEVHGDCSHLEFDPKARKRRAWADYDAVLVTAGSIARAVVDLLGMPDPHVAVVTLGVPSAAASDAVGLRVDAVAATQDGPGVVDALIRALTEENR